MVNQVTHLVPPLLKAEGRVNALSMALRVAGAESKVERPPKLVAFPLNRECAWLCALCISVALVLNYESRVS